jgi:hypothetical protein
MAAVAWLVGRAIHLNDGYYSFPGLLLITAAILICAGAVLLPRIELLESLPAGIPIAIVVCAVVTEVVMLVRGTPVARWGIVTVGILGLLQAFRLGRLRLALIAVTLGVFCIVASIVFRRVVLPPIDVLVFQQMGAEGLLRGENPYTPRYPNLYRADQPYYGPGVVDASNRLTVGLPYPPLSLLLALPAYVLGGDVRYADVAAIAAAAWLMVMFRPGRWTGLTAMLFLLTPRVLFVIEQSWTEALFVFMFALVMFCALRWKPALPYALGLFFATKQYAVLTLPFISFLVAPEDRWADIGRLLGKAMLVAGAITLPFFLWDPHAFWRAVVQFQFIQPMRWDSLSYLVGMYRWVPRFPLLMSAAFVAIVPVIGLAVWRCPRSPAYFAAATTLVSLVFFAFNKQAFCNYYYYVVATACCAAAAASVPASRATETRPVR